jgi:putative PIN family toxin of toxin-antitoxin system
VKKDTKEKQQTGLRVVFDTNVYVSALNFPNSPLTDLVEHAQRGTYQLIISPAIVNEVADVLRRFEWTERDIRVRLKTITKSSEIVMPQTVPDVIKEDPDDNHILACALAGNANLIVSRDLDLLRLKMYGTIGIMSPIDFLHTLEGVKKAA